MADYKICVYAISKNEAKFVDQWMDSMGEADLVVVTDTGSCDDTVEKLQKRGAVVYKETVEPWRFDVARNLSLEHVPEDTDICVCTDLDEIFEPGWRKSLERAWKAHQSKHSGPVARTGRYLYNWSLKEDGTPDIQFYYFKIHERQGFRWKCPVHEYIHYVGSLSLEKVFIDGMVLNHYPDPAKSRGSYLPLLEMAVEEDPLDERMRYYLGREYLYKEKWQECKDTLETYLTMPSARWDEERCAAMRWIAKSCWKLGLLQESYGWYYKAISEAPHMRDPYIEFSKMCYELANWPLTLFLAEEALKITEKSKTFVNMGYSWDFTPHDLCAIAAYHMRLTDKAVEHAKKALSFEPHNERLQQNLAAIQKAKATCSSS